MPSRYWQYLQECLCSGNFGSVQLGMVREEVRTRLGEPDDVGGTSCKRRVPLVWKYGEVELHFAKSGELVSIFWEDEQGNTIFINENGSKIHSAELKGVHSHKYADILAEL